MDMDYIDPEDEFELMYENEMEMLRDMEEDIEVPNTIYPKPNSKRSLDFDTPSTSKAVPPSQITHKDSETVDLTQSSQPDLGCLPLDNCNKRRVSELFGDIDDIDLDDDRDYVKKIKFDDDISSDKRQDLLIEMIKTQRKQVTDERTLRENKHFKGPEKKIEDCMSRNVPSWPFVATNDSEGKRIYLRENLKDDIANKFCISQIDYKKSGLLDVPYEVLKREALNEIILKEEKKIQADKIDVMEIETDIEKDLWVEKYKPKMYLELLSNEATNRKLLEWLKLWDKIVFNRNPAILKKMELETDRKNIIDEYGRPIQKVALLCGPPGLGKTTLAHMIVRQAGYKMVEINASDDRSAQVFRSNLEASTQMKSVLGSNPKPNCLILDEIDGAPQAAIDVLVKFVAGKVDKKKKKGGNEMLKRPIICICNDIYVPALRPLRQIALTLNFPPITSVRLGERLMEIIKSENILSDLGTMMALSEKTNNDIRSCLSVLHCLKPKGRVTLTQIQATNIGIKDVQQGLFSVWQLIFQNKIMTKKQGLAESNETILNKRLKNVVRSVQSFGDYDRLATGVYENYLNLRPKDSSLKQVLKTLNWFCFHDKISHIIQSTQNYALYPYLPYSFVAWNLLLSTSRRPELQYPSTAYEMNKRQTTFKNTLDFALAGMPAYLRAYQHKENLLVDVIPYLIHLIIPNLRPVSVQLYSAKERLELDRVVKIMADYNLNYTQERTMEGSYSFNLDPNIEDIGFFGERPRERIFGYAGKQMISKEVETEKLRRTQGKMGEVLNKPACEIKPKHTEKFEQPLSPAIPNHLQKLTPKSLKKKVEMKAKDFFGRVVEKNLNNVKEKAILELPWQRFESREKHNSCDQKLSYVMLDLKRRIRTLPFHAKTDEIVKSDIWFHFKEGHNNAVKKTVYMSDLL